MKYVLLTVSALAMTACSQPQPTPTEPVEPAPPAQTETLAPAPSLQDFVERAAMGDLFEVEAGRLAVQRTQNPTIRTFAQEMVDAHTAMSNDLRAALTGLSGAPTPPTALDAEHQQKIQALRDAGADRFDELYLDQQTEAHENALNLFRGYGQGGDNAALRAFASSKAPTIEQHLSRVREIDQSGADE